MRVLRNGSVARIFLVLVSLLGVRSARAESLAEAAEVAYQSSPALLERRANQRAFDESYFQARAGWHPTLSAEGTVIIRRQDLGAGQGAELLTDANGNLVPVGGGGSLSYNSAAATLQLNQPIYTGGRIGSAVNAAEADLLVGREDLRMAEIQLMQAVVQAFADMRQNLEIVAVRRTNQVLVAEELHEAEAKYILGQVTQIDVAQARAQAAAARFQLASAQGQLSISAAAFTGIVGHAPAELEAEPRLKDLPPSLDVAFSIANVASPLLRSANYAERASHFRLAEARAARRPNVTASMSIGYVGAIAPFSSDRFDRTVGGAITLSQPFYSGGTIESQIRQAVERDTAAWIAIEGARRTTVQNVAEMWSRLEVARASVGSLKEQVSASELAFQGLREQNRLGVATTIDLFVQQQQLREAQLLVIKARHDQLIAEAGLLAAVGQLTISSLSPETPQYNPQVYVKEPNRSAEALFESVPRFLDHLTAGRP